MAGRRVGTPIVATLALIATVLLAAAPPAGAAGKKTCWVKNTTLAKSYGPATGSVLQDAIDNASSGNDLEVRGRCIGNFTIHQALTLVGVAKNGYPVATLDGNLAGSVLSVYSTVTLTDLTITNGLGTDGGGIFNDDGGTLTMNGSSSVSSNAADDDGGGIYNAGTLTMNDSSSVNGNTAANYGGGVFNTGTLTMNGSSSVSGNTAGLDGGGIFNCSSLVGASDGGNVHDNEPNNIGTCT